MTDGDDNNKRDLNVQDVFPGALPGESEYFRYVSFDKSQRPADVFETVVWKLQPTVFRNGGVSLDNFILTLPDGTPFYALELNGDVAGLHIQIERGAELLGLLTGTIEGDRFVVSDGRSIALSECGSKRERSWRNLTA